MSTQTPVVQELTPGLVDSTALLLHSMSVSFAGVTALAMGKSICRRALAQRDVVVLVAVDAGSAAGVVAAIVDAPDFWTRFLLARPMLLAIVVAHRVRSRILAQFGRRDSAPPGAAEGNSPAPTSAPLSKPAGHDWRDPLPSTAKILFVGVHPEYRRRGLGEALYRSLASALAGRGIERIYARVDHDNEASLLLHHRTGWVLYNEPDSVLAVLTLGEGL